MHRNRKKCLAIAVSLVLAAGTTTLAQPAPEPSRDVPFQVDSGFIVDPAPNVEFGNEPQMVWMTEVSVPGSSWLRVHFGRETLLAGPDRHNGGAYLVITSVLDGAKHYLDAKTLPEWDNISAFMNGDTVLVELYAAPGRGDNRVTIEQVTAGEPIVPETICGTTDDRIPYNDPRAGRLSTGCTAWLISTNGNSNEFLTAGHCISNNQSGVVVRFNVPASTSTGGLVNPPPEFQFSVQSSSIQSNGGLGQGNDYARFFTSNNSNTGLPARVAQGLTAYALASSAPASGTAATTVQGYGTVNNQAGIPNVPWQWQQLGKVHSGPYAGKSGTAIRYNTDTSGGNSGSPVTQIFTVLGIPIELAIGIHTHGGCPGSPNVGTAIELAALQNAINNPAGTPYPYVSAVHKGLFTTLASNNGGSDGGTIYFDLEVNDQAVTVTSFNLNINRNSSTNNGTSSEDDDFYNFEVYLAPETAVGKTGNITLWTKVADGGGMPKFEDEYSLGALKNTFVLGPNQSYGVAIVFDSGAGHAYTNATGSNEVYMNDDLTLTGIAASNTKFGSTINGRVFNGSVNYDLNQAVGQCLETIYEGGNGLNTGSMVYFDVDVKGTPIALSGLAMNTAAPAGTAVDIKLYRTASTYVGKTTSSSGWTLVAEGTGTSAGQGFPTHVALNNFVHLNANTGYGFAILAEHTAGGLAHVYTNGNGLNQSYEDSHLEMTLGASSSGAFSGSQFSPRIFNGALCYAVDLQAPCKDSLVTQLQPLTNVQALNSNPGAQEEADNINTGTKAWNVTAATVWGTYSNTNLPPASQDFVVRFFTDSGGLPGSLVATRNVNNVMPVDTGLIMDPFTVNPSIYQYDLSFTTVNLPAGQYWISVLGNEPTHTWSWCRTNTTANAHAVRQGTGSWTISSGDFAYVLCGESVTACYPDCDQNGNLDLFDFLCFVNAFNNGDPYADCDGSGGLDLFDFLCFVNAFNNGCP